VEEARKDSNRLFYKIIKKDFDAEPDDVENDSAKKLLHPQSGLMEQKLGKGH
jgi:hypothetical protein